MSLFTTQGYRYQLVAGSNVILDTYADESIKISNNITDLFDIGAVPGTFTRTITLPGTKKNNAFFEQYYDISVYGPDTFDANQKVPAYLDFGSVYLVNGYLQLMKINVIENKFVDSYEITLFGAISNFSVETNKLFLTDLDNLSVFNHTSSVANILASSNYNLFSGSIVYPLADYGKRITFSTTDYVGVDDNTDGLTVSDYKPAIRVKDVFDAVFEKVGFTYSSSFMNQDEFKDIYMILNNNKRYPEYAYADLENYYQGSVSTNTGSFQNYFVPSGSVGGDGVNIPMTTIDNDPYSAFTVGNPFTYFAPLDYSNYTLNLNLSYRVTYNAASTLSQYPVFYLSLYRTSDNALLNTTVLTVLNEYSETTSLGATVTKTESYIAGQDFNLPLPSGSAYFKLFYRPFTNQVDGTPTQIFPKNFNVHLNPTGSREGTSFQVKQVRQAADNRVLDIAKNMPFGTNGIKLIEFVRAVQKKFNLVIYEDKTTPYNFIVEPFNTWYLSGQVQDFNQYINVKNKLEFIPANTLAVNKVSFTDKLDADYVSKVFQQVNNRTYGQSFFIDTGSYFSQGEFKVETSFASGPIFQIPLTGASGSATTGVTCTEYRVTNESDNLGASVTYTNCAGVSTVQSLPRISPTAYICVRGGTTPTYVGIVSTTQVGDCSPTPSGSAASGSFLPITIPLYIGDQNYSPTQVFPRIMYYNGQISSSRYYIEGLSDPPNSVSSTALNTFPYFDNYNVVSGSYPTIDSKSLLFNNESATNGSTPENSLISDYWSTYLGLLYNPRTRLVNASAVIPLAKYFEMELNDLVQFRGNYYHLRAINDYDLTTGECLVQLLGPVISDAVSAQLFGTSGSI